MNLQTLTETATVKWAVAAKVSSMLGGMLAGVMAYGISQLATGNAIFALAVSAACSTVVAWVRSRPQYVAAISAAKISEGELLGKQTAALIERLNKDAQDNSLIADLQVVARHEVQRYYQASVAHINLLEIIMEEHSVHVPEFKHEDIGAVLKNLDNQILAIKGERKRADAAAAVT